MKALEGVRVLDISRLLPGPAASAWLEGQGAMVDAIEPLTGDMSRHIPPFVDGKGAYFAAHAGAKRRMAMNPRHALAPEVLHRLLPHYDVLIEGFRPGVLEALGLDEATRAQRYPKLVVARLSGYGQSGPWARLPGHDINYVGLAGLLSDNERGPDGNVIVPAIQVADMAGALAAAASICAALVSVARTGQGRTLDIAITEAAAWIGAASTLAASASEPGAEPGSSILGGGFPLYGVYRCQDGAFITLGAIEPRFQQAIAAHTGGDLSRAALTSLFASKAATVWLDLFREACVGPMLSTSSMPSHEQFLARDAVRQQGGATFVRPVAGDWPSRDAHSDEVGAQTHEILAAAGYTVDEISRYKDLGAIA